MITSHKWPPLNCLRGFEAAARLNSFSKAAFELNMTQSAVSHQIKTLENYLEQPLFIRINRKVVLSDAGIDLLVTTEECLNILENGLKRLEQYKKPNQLIVHTTSAFAAQWLVPRLNHFRAHHRDIDIWLYTTDGEPDLDLAEVHVGILYGRGRWPGMSSTKLLPDTLVPLCAPDFPIMLQDDISAEDLVNYTLLHGEQRETWQTWFASVGQPEINPIAGPNFTNPSLMLQAAKQGQGIALSSLILAADDIEKGALICPLNKGIKSRYAYYMVHKHEGLDSPQLGIFINWLTAETKGFHDTVYLQLESGLEKN